MLEQDGQAMLWDLNEGKHLYTLDGGDVINSLCFSPNRYWLCAATGPSIKIWVRTFPPPHLPLPPGPGDIHYQQIVIKSLATVKKVSRIEKIPEGTGSRSKVHGYSIGYCKLSTVDS